MMNWKTILLGVAVIGVAFFAPLATFAAACPPGLGPPNQCIRVNNTFDNGYTVSGQITEQRGIYAPGTRATFTYNSQGGLTKTAIGDRGEPLPPPGPASQPPANTSLGGATAGACTATQRAQGYSTYDNSYFPRLQEFFGIEVRQICAKTLEDAQLFYDTGGKVSDAAALTEQCGKPSRLDVGYQLCRGIFIALNAIQANFFKWIFSFLGYLAWLFLKVAQVWLALGLWFMDGAIFYTVFLMGAYINGSTAIPGISEAWSVIRDIANILIIGGFVTIGISTILQIDGYSANRYLARLIIAALLVNFSFFFAGAAIDATNYVSVKIYTSDFFTRGCTGNQASVVSSAVVIFPLGRALYDGVMAGNIPASICSIGGSFMSYTKMSSWTDLRNMGLTMAGFSAQGEGDTNYNQINQEAAGMARPDEAKKNLEWNLMILALMGGIFSLLTGFVFIMVAFALIARFVTLILLLVTSPFGIAGVSIPYVDKYAGQWWTMFASQALFAPIFFILIGIGLTVIRGMSERLVAQGETYGKAIADVSQHAGQGWLVGHLGLFMTFFIGIAFIWLSYTVAKRMSESVEEFKPLYGIAAARAMNVLRMPLAPVFGGPLTGGYGLLSPLRALLTQVAGASKEGGLVEWTMKAVNVGLRYPTRLGLPEQKGAKTHAEEVDDDVKRAREGFDRADMLYGKTVWPRNPGGLRELFPGKRSKAQEKELKARIHSIKPEDISSTLKPADVERALEQGLFTPEQEAAIFASPNYSAGQKRKFRDAILTRFNKVRKDREAGKASWTDVANAYEDLSKTGREQAFVDDPSLEKDPNFVGAMKSKNFEDHIADMTNEDKGKMRALRKKGQEDALKAARDDKRKTAEERENAARVIIERMNEDEKKDMSPDTIRATNGHLRQHEVELIWKRGSDAQRAALKESEKYAGMIEEITASRGPSMRNTAGTPTASAGSADSVRTTDAAIARGIRAMTPPSQPADMRDGVVIEPGTFRTPFVRPSTDRPLSERPGPLGTDVTPGEQPRGPEVQTPPTEPGDQQNKT